MIDWSNFHDSTSGSFAHCEVPTREPDFTSLSGSRYWREETGVIRESNHWCKGIRSCDWLLEGAEYYGLACGRINFADLELGAARKRFERIAACERYNAKCRKLSQIKQVGNRVKITRTVSQRIGSRRFATITETLVVIIEKFTPRFLVASGQRFGLSTINNWEAA